MSTNVCECGHSKLSHPFGLSENIVCSGKCQLCNCGEYRASSPSVAKGEPPDLLLKYSKSKILREEALEDSCADCAKQNGVDRTSDRADAEIVENTTNSSVRYNGKPQESSFVKPEIGGVN